MTDDEEAKRMSEAQLVEKVARACCASVNSDDTWEETGTDVHEMAWHPIARAAIAVLRPIIRDEALEEAAKVADGWVGYPEWSADTNSGYECASRNIAAAIRALKEIR